MHNNSKRIGFSLSVVLCLVILAVVSGNGRLAAQSGSTQEKLDRDLIAAIKRLDAKAVIGLLKNGANAKGENRLKLLLTLTDYPFDKRLSANPDIIAEALIKHGANIDYLNPQGMPTLQHAAHFGWHKTVRLLLNNGADPNIHNPYGESTPLFFTDAECTAMLLKYGANPNVCDEPQKWMPLHFACLHQDAKRVHLLLEAGADPEAKTRDGETPLMLTHSVKVAQEMMRHSADINAKDKDGESVLFRVQHFWKSGDLLKPELYRDIVRFLVKHGAHE